MSLIALYGATGALGRRVSRVLVAQGAAVRLGGRNAGRLEAAAADLARETGWQGGRHAAALDDGPGLRAFLDGCRVVVNAGPTAGGGDRLIEAAMEAGAGYVDAAGSQPFIHHVFEHYGPAAARRGTALVPGFGFDYALGDCLAYLVARSGDGDRAVRRVTVGYALDGSDVSSNSLQFAAETRGGGELFYEAGAWTPARLGIHRHALDFPAPFGRQSMARYAAGEIITVPRHTATDEVVALVTTRSLVPHPALVPLFPYLRPLVALARRTPARHLLGLALRLRGARNPAPAPDGTPPARPPRFAIVVEIQPRDGEPRRGIVEGGDFHDVTAATLAFGAGRLASPSFNARGALAPAAAVDPRALFDALAPLGVSWRVSASQRR